MWNNKKQQNSCFPLCQTYKPTIILDWISKKWTKMFLADVRICNIPPFQRISPIQTKQLSRSIFFDTKELSSPVKSTDDLGNKPLPEPMLTQIYVAIWCH